MLTEITKTRSYLILSKSTQRVLAGLPATHTRYVSSSTLPPLSLSTIRLTCVLCSPSPRFYRLVSSSVSVSVHVPFALCLRPLRRVDWLVSSRRCTSFHYSAGLFLLAVRGPSNEISHCKSKRSRVGYIVAQSLPFQVVLDDICKSFLPFSVCVPCCCRSLARRAAVVQ
ncbi:hypothetical protein BDN71DRAFT_222421 [Pleurotus eryngii]|uniref:Uncharacterized protein n=1 Tax=Pleurotus eryngii TaxID=5323 RepID=A0A9P6D2L5_PLEER|nr:hypothetical protein BDN71DRAFT_222421 [Pleurotus eryngii]